MKAYCNKCDYEFEYKLNSINDLDNLKCPKCNEKVSPKSKKLRIPTKHEEKMDNILYGILHFLRIIYLFIAIIGIIGYFHHHETLLIICTVLCVVLYSIERIIGLNYLSFLLIATILSFIICINKIGGVVDCIFLSICIGFAVSTVIREIYILIIDFIFYMAEKSKN